MGTIKNEKDLLVGAAKEKIGELTKNKELEKSGQEQLTDAKEQKEIRKQRIEELESRNDELNAQNQSHMDQSGRKELLKETAGQNEQPPIPANERRDADHLKHYTGIEEKL